MLYLGGTIEVGGVFSSNVRWKSGEQTKQGRIRLRFDTLGSCDFIKRNWTVAGRTTLVRDHVVAA